MAQVQAETVLALGAVAIAGYVVWRVSRAAGNAASAVGDVLQNAGNQLWTAGQGVATAVNPANPKNVFYSGVNAAGSAATGEKDWSLGSAIYDWLHPGEMDWLNPRPTMTSGGGGDYQGNGASGSW